MIVNVFLTSVVVFVLFYFSLSHSFNDLFIPMPCLSVMRVKISVCTFFGSLNVYTE